MIHHDGEQESGWKTWKLGNQESNAAYCISYRKVVVVAFHGLAFKQKTRFQYDKSDKGMPYSFARYSRWLVFLIRHVVNACVRG